MNLERLETRLNCIELAKEQDTGERGLYTIQGWRMDQEELGRWRHLRKRKNRTRLVANEKGRDRRKEKWNGEPVLWSGSGTAADSKEESI